MDMRFPHVMTPMRVGPQLFRNHIVCGPSNIHSATHGELWPIEEAMRYWEARARAGAAVVTVTGASVTPGFDNGIHLSWDLYVKNHTKAIAELANRIHFYGAKASMELLGVFPEDYAVSDGARLLSGMPGRQVPVSEMERLKGYFVQAAAALRDADFDGVLLHFGHSMPVAQFLSPFTNKRTDEYGGDTDGRCRYCCEIIKAIRAECGPGFFIEVRFSGTEFQEGGIDIPEGIRIGERFQAAGADLLQISCGMHNPTWMTWTHPCSYLPPLPNVYIAEAFKKSGKFHVPIGTVGGIQQLSDADAIIADGKADYVVITRGFIADIDLIKKANEGCSDDVVPCIKCMRCHDSAIYGEHVQCSVNPTVGIGHVIDEMVRPAARSKRVAVVGGGPGGMVAAIVAHDRGHSVTLFDDSDQLGGALKFADYVSFKYSLKNYKDFLVRQVAKRGIDTRLNTRVTPADLKDAVYDAIIAAVGADIVSPPIPGITGSNVMTAVDSYGHEAALGDNVVILGGGQIGCETALHLAKSGQTVTILEMRSELAPDASPTHRDELLLEISKTPNLRVLLDSKCLEVRDGSVIYEHMGASKEVGASFVLNALGMKARTAAADSFIGLSDEFAEIGNCVKARTVEFAVREGYFAAVNL